METQIDPGTARWIIGFAALVVVVAALLAYGFIHQLMLQPTAVTGKKDIYTRIFFLFGVVASLCIVGALCVSGALDKVVVGHVVVMIVAALAVKRIDDSISKDT